MTVLLTGVHPEHGTLWVAVDPSVHHIDGSVRKTRFGARLAPFRSLEEGRAALVASGALLERSNV